MSMLEPSEVPFWEVHMVFLSGSIKYVGSKYVCVFLSDYVLLLIFIASEKFVIY